MLKLICRFRCDERGAAVIEYGLLLAFAVVVCLAAMRLLGGAISSALSYCATALAAI
jgi:Flp pilus assembly pilin Flp